MFRRPTYNPPKLRDREPGWLTPASRPGVYADCGQLGLAAPKENAIYSEPYRRLVAALPCANCDIEQFSQAAHPPPTAKGRKEDDRKCFPLCCTRPGTDGCHKLFDTYKLIPKALMAETAAMWGAETREIIIENGMWPAGLPLLEKAP